MSVAIQIKKDVTSFEFWKNNLPQPRTNKFHLNSNFLGIHAANHFDNPHVFADSFTTESVIETLTHANSISYALSKSEEYKCTAFIHLNELPMKKKYKKLVEEYAVTLMER